MEWIFVRKKGEKSERLGILSSLIIWFEGEKSERLGILKCVYLLDMLNINTFIAQIYCLNYFFLWLMIFYYLTDIFIAILFHVPQFPTYILLVYRHIIHIGDSVFIPTLSYKTSDLNIEFSCGKGQKSKRVAR